MAKTLDNTEGTAETPISESAKSAAKPQQPAQQPPQQNMQLEVDDAKVANSYVNFCRVTGSPEELIIDFGLNPQPMGIPTKPIVVDHRIVMNFFTAKRLLAALQMSIQRHEAVFGVLETDVQRRVQRNSGN